MLNKIDCPSYIQTTTESNDGKVSVEVAMVPWDQFHSHITDVMSNNSKIVEANTLLNDWIRTPLNQMMAGELNKLVKRTKDYLEGQ